MVCIEDQDIRLERLSACHEDKYLAAVAKSHKLHFPFVFPPKTAEEFSVQLTRSDFSSNYSLLATHKQDQELVAVVNLNNIIRGGFQNAFLGYYVFAPYVARGLMRQSLQLAIEFAKNNINLHRLEANIQPDNIRSINLVKSLSFIKEGYSKDYLKINGKWCDHERWALIL